MVTTDKGKIGIIVICLGLVCSTGSFLYLDSSDPMGWVMTKEGQAGIMIAILSFWLGIIVLIVGIVISVVEYGKKNSC